MTHSIGHATFTRVLTPRELDLMEQLSLKKIFELNVWWLEGQFPYRGCNQLFEIMKASTAKDIDFYDNTTPTLIKEIVHIDFPALKQLNLCSNNIETVEHLQLLRAVNLEVLLLNCNNITNAKSLRKGNFPKLRTLSLDNNKIIDVSFLALGSWTDLAKIQFDFDDFQDEFPVVEDITPLFKIKASRLSHLSWDYERKPRNAPMRKAIGLRFKGIFISGMPTP